MWIGGFHYPGNNSGTHFSGINDSGQIVGTVLGVYGTGIIGFFDAGFLYNGDTYTPLRYPSADITHANGINNGGQIVGYYSDSLSGVAHGFLYSGGSYITLDDPLATGGTYLSAINNTGQIVDYYNDGSGQHGFLYNHGSFTTLDNPLGVGTSLTGINDYGQIVGNYGITPTAPAIATAS
jgi:probable HAF family extracellular repeat protein